MSCRRIVLDTATTGLDSLSHRIIEIAAAEMKEDRLTGYCFHSYINPGRDMDPEVEQIYGISSEFLRDKPRMSDIADQLLMFLDGCDELIIHNAHFDIAFLNRELGQAGWPALSDKCPRILDTLRMAERIHPGELHGLHALCDRYGIPRAHTSERIPQGTLTCWRRFF